MIMQTTNAEAAKSGDRKLALQVLRDTLAEQLDTTSASIHAQLAAQYRATLAELAELDAALSPGEESELDRIRRERETGSRATAARSRSA